jgi:hypothetical protein
LFPRGLVDDGHLQAAADHAGDVEERRALVGDLAIGSKLGERYSLAMPDTVYLKNGC